MPQFDFYSFYEQVLVLLLILVVFHLVFLKFYFVSFLQDIKTQKKLNYNLYTELHIINLFFKNS